MNASYLDQSFSEILIAEGILTQRDLSRLLGERESATEPIAWIIQKPNTLNLTPNKQWYTWRTPQALD